MGSRDPRIDAYITNALASYVRQAMKFNEDGVKAPWMERRGKPKPPPRVPADLKAALARNQKAKAAFDGFTTSHKREYVEWITEAKSAETRNRRVATTLEWLAQGKPRNWKYL